VNDGTSVQTHGIDENQFCSIVGVPSDSCGKTCLYTNSTASEYAAAINNGSAGGAGGAIAGIIVGVLLLLCCCFFYRYNKKQNENSHDAVADCENEADAVDEEKALRARGRSKFKRAMKKNKENNENGAEWRRSFNAS